MIQTQNIYTLATLAPINSTLQSSEVDFLRKWLLVLRGLDMEHNTSNKKHEKILKGGNMGLMARSSYRWMQIFFVSLGANNRISTSTCKN